LFTAPNMEWETWILPKKDGKRFFSAS